MRFNLVCIALGFVILASGCGPSESEQIATITQIAADIVATQTAQAPTPPPFAPGETRIAPVDNMTMIDILAGDYTLGSTQAASLEIL